MHTRTLTINFQRSITAGVPNTMEVAIAPLNDPGAPASNALLVGGTQVQTVVLSNEVNTITFDLVPTDLPELTSRVTYRAAWRERYMGRQYTQDFVMPDFDVVFADLEELGNILGGTTYLQWSDRGRANGVAGLNASGQVIDATGTPVGGNSGSTTALQTAIEDEIVARIQGDENQMDFYLQHIQDATDGVLATLTGTLNAALAAVNSNLGDESGLRQQAVDSLNTTLTNLQTAVTATITSLAAKADLVGGKVPVGQLPSVMFGKAVSVANESAMLALTTGQINPGDFAVRPDGIYFLNAANPAVLANWVRFRDNSAVLTVNGLTGAVTLTATDVGARPTATPIPQADITGLVAALNTKSSTTAVTDVANRVTALETLGLSGGGQLDTTAKTSWWTASGPTTNMNAVSLRSPFGFNGVSYYYDPAGAVAGEAVFPYLTPNGHLKFVARNESNSVDPVYATLSALNSLTTAVSAKASQTALDSLTTTVNAKAEAADLTALTAVVNTKASTASVATINSALPNKANQTDLLALTTTVGTKANQSDLTALTTTVGTKASQSALDALTTTVGTKALQSDLTALTTTVGTKATTSSVTALTTRVTAVETGKADLDVSGKILSSQLPNMSLTSVTTVNSRAEMLALTTAQVQPGDVALINDSTADRGSYILTGADPAQLANWTRLVTPTAGVVTVNSINPVSGNITLSAASVGARAAGVDILQSEVTGLTAALAAKADATTTTTALATKIALADAQALLTAATPLKWRADLVDTTSTAVPSGTGITIDGTTVSSGNVVLLTNQSPASKNGLYVAGAGTWARATDMAVGSYFLKGTSVMVLGGTTNTGTIYQQSQAAGVVNTNANNWTKVFTAGSGSTNAITASSGVQKVTVNNSGTITYDFQLDTSVAARKWSGYVTPQSGNSAIVTHNLGTQNVIAWFRDASTKDSVLVGWKPTDNNNISVEFNAPIGSTQFWATVIG